jgi:hypothetical protein
MGLIGHSALGEDDKRTPRQVAFLSQLLSVDHRLHRLIQAVLTVVPLDVHALTALTIKVTNRELLHEGGWRETWSELAIHEGYDVHWAVMIRNDRRAALETLLFPFLDSLFLLLDPVWSKILSVEVLDILVGLVVANLVISEAQVKPTPTQPTPRLAFDPSPPACGRQPNVLASVHDEAPDETQGGENSKVNQKACKQQTESSWIELPSGPLLNISSPKGRELCMELFRHHSNPVSRRVCPLKKQDADHTLYDKDLEPNRLAHRKEQFLPATAAAH